jgi:general stress protein 26
MATQFKQLNQDIIDFIQKQKIYFVSSTTKDGYINLSPKGMDSLRIINNNRVIWLNSTGSTNETSSNIQRDNRITIMFCSFDEQALIVKLFGKAKVIHKNDKEYNELSKLLPDIPGARQIFDINLELIITVCGSAVPFFDYKGEREDLNLYWKEAGDNGLKDYWKRKNTKSLNGYETNIIKNIINNKA